MTPPVIAAPRQRRYAPCALVSATPSVPINLPDFLERKAGRQ